MKEIIQTPAAPAAIGPYSQAVRHAGLVFLSGQIPLDPATGQLAGGGIREQTERVLENIKAVLEASGASLDTVLKTTIFLQDLSDFAAVNEVYARYFHQNPPARSTVEAARLPREVRIEIEAIAFTAAG